MSTRKLKTQGEALGSRAFHTNGSMAQGIIAIRRLEQFPSVFSFVYEADSTEDLISRAASERSLGEPAILWRSEISSQYALEMVLWAGEILCFVSWALRVDLWGLISVTKRVESLIEQEGDSLIIE